ncbi:MAG: hypothetical protein ACI86M_002345 [Saprospiraceae bacterium]|jgi:hypothetical protein
MNPKTMNYWYKYHISNYDDEKISGEFAGTTAYLSDEQTGEVVKDKVIPEHTGYAYVFNNPINYNDPTGMMGEGVASTVVNDRGYIIDHKDDGDSRIFLNERSDDTVIGYEREGESYEQGGYLQKNDLKEDAKLPYYFLITMDEEDLKQLNETLFTKGVAPDLGHGKAVKLSIAALKKVLPRLRVPKGKGWLDVIKNKWLKGGQFA